MAESTSIAAALAQGRDAFARGAWGDAYARLSAAAREGPLDAEDTDRLARAAHLIGRDDECSEAWARAHQQFLSDGNAERAAMCTFWLGMMLMFRGDMAQSNGWLARGRRLLDEGRHDCVVNGYLLVPVGIRAVMAGDAAAAYDAFRAALDVGARFADGDLVAFSRLGQGRALMRQGRTAEGVALLDEAMVSVAAGEVSSMVAGRIYCSVIEGCQEIFDLERAQEWTSALAQWCAAQPDLVLHRGECLLHRAELMMVHGAWPDALHEARLACDWLSRPPGRGAGAAFYQQGEVHRVRGEFALAEEAYRQASQRGRTPQPGLAKLRLAQGDVEAAQAAIRQAMANTHERRIRAAVLGAGVEIMLAAGDVPAARAAAQELAGIADAVGAAYLRAAASQARGAVLLAEARPREALPTLDDACAAWRELRAPYEEARVRLAMGLAHRALGDDDTAAMDLDAAIRTFRELGAAADLAQAKAAAAAPRSTRGVDRLTVREFEVLGLVATGRTNRAIASELVISEKTVARHVSNIFTKLGLSTRAAATAYAYQHHLLRPRT